MQPAKNKCSPREGKPQKSSLMLQVVLGGLILAGLFALSQHRFLLFHGFVELFSVAVAWAVFLLVWNTRRISRNDGMLFLGVAYFFTGLLDLVHTLSYRGMGIFPEELSSNYATQLWLPAGARPSRFSFR